jgi:hypothetical protein
LTSPDLGSEAFNFGVSFKSSLASPNFAILKATDDGFAIRSADQMEMAF